MKIGRNDLCPCGSGKKYKKCCLNNQVAGQEVKIQPSSKMWTLEDVEQMETEAILELLQEFGIPVDKDYFISEIENFSSAEELVQLWIENYQLDIRNHLSDFTLLAIKVLAKRLTPEHLLLEYLDDWMNEGYEFAEVNDHIHASLLWWKVWKHLPKWIGDRNITSIGELDEITSSSMSNLFYNWVQDFELGLANARLSDGQFIPTRLIFAEEFLEQFPDTDESIIANMTVAMGESLFYLGKINEADNVFREYVMKHPNNPWTYIHWGDLYNPKMHSKTADKGSAITLYKDAIRVAVDASDRDVASDRLYELENVY
ncbi:SEC-C domain-containing protein [Oceanobacillus arenosus]|uniref:SEC-C domain-containing protein n=1 Tax=Oceanobacillus arenosus TaxID=1229153 RepID=UPI001FE8636D|nr:SEC-C domain-containing protein [Oceanobacillus arenosus]